MTQQTVRGSVGARLVFVCDGEDGGGKLQHDAPWDAQKDAEEVHPLYSHALQKRPEINHLVPIRGMPGKRGADAPLPRQAQPASALMSGLAATGSLPP